MHFDFQAFSMDHFRPAVNYEIFMVLFSKLSFKPHCIRCSRFKVDDVGALEASSKPPVRIVEDNVTASLHQQRTPVRSGCRDDVTWIC
jgi:hypothetical protein